MGNLETLCDQQQVRNMPEHDPSLLDDIIKSRQQLKENPPAPIHIQALILDLLKLKSFDELYKDSIVWKVTTPYRFCYVNEKQNKNRPPFGKCSLYLYREKGEFIGFYRGYIDDNGFRRVKQSLYVYASGDYFIGDKEKPNFGVYKSDEMNYTYTGDWAKGLPHGYGKQQSEKGTYEGYFMNGKKQGQGKCMYSDSKTTYQGQFVNNQASGKGKIENLIDKYSYTGEFKCNKKHGLGIESTNKFLYDGRFYMNLKCGQGKILYYEEDIEYEGQFFNDKPHGLGVCRIKEVKVKGVWENGIMRSILENCSNSS